MDGARLPEAGPTRSPGDQVRFHPGCPADIHVWQGTFEGAHAHFETAMRLLPPDELERAARFRVETARAHFVLTRAYVRTILGAYLNTRPLDLTLAYNAFGRPSLEDAANPDGLTFNISHSGDRCLIALAWGRDVGVDVEDASRTVDVLDLSNRFFSPSEAEAISGQPMENRADTFFTVWTQKEAFIKAMGDGLSRSLGSFDVNPRRRFRSTVATRPDPALGQGFTMLQLDPGAGYAGALAFPGDFEGLVFHHLDVNSVLQRGDHDGR